MTLVKNENSDKYLFFRISCSSWRDVVDTGWSIGLYIIFCQGCPVDFSTFVLISLAMSLAEVECNAGATAGIALSYL